MDLEQAVIKNLIDTKKPGVEIPDVIQGVSKRLEKTIAVGYPQTLQQAAEFLCRNFKVVSRHSDGNFTTVVVSDGASYYTGSSKRNPIDRPSRLRGESLALSRAVRTALEALLLSQN